MSKAADAFRTISEIAEELRVPKHVLRFWELKFPQLKPMKRGGGRRYYRPEDLELLRGIQHLLHADGYTIKGVQRILREQGVEAAKAAASNPLQYARLKPGASTTKVAKPSKPGVATSATKRPTATRASPSNHNESDHTAKQLARAINELEACRSILRAHTAPVQAAPKKTPRKTAPKQRRATASR